LLLHRGNSRQKQSPTCLLQCRCGNGEKLIEKATINQLSIVAQKQHQHGKICCSTANYLSQQNVNSGMIKLIETVTINWLSFAAQQWQCWQQKLPLRKTATATNWH